MKTSFRRYGTLSLLVGGLLLTACEKDEAKPEPVPDAGSGVLNPGDSGEGELTEAEPLSRHELATQAGHFYRLSCHADTLPGCEVRRLDPSTLEPLPPVTYKAYADSTITWRAAVDETVVVDVRASINSSVKFGRYTLDFTETEDTEGDALENAVSKAVPSEFSGVLNAPFPDDVDVFRFSLPKGHILSVRCYGPNFGPQSEMVRADGTVLNTYSYAGPRDGESALSGENDTGEDLYVRVFSRAGQGGGAVEGYQCTAADSGVDDHPDAPPEATVVTVPSTTEVVFWPVGDVDVLAVDLVEGHKYRLSSLGIAPFYAATTVLDAQGAIVAKDLESDYLPGTEFTAPATARYFLSLRRVRGAGVYKFLFPTSFTYSIAEIAP
ncbi:hypothetical protein [Corallococcus sp. M7]